MADNQIILWNWTPKELYAFEVQSENYLIEKNILWIAMFLLIFKWLNLIETI